MNPMRQPMIDLIRATIESNDRIIRISGPRECPHLDFGQRYGTDLTKVMVWPHPGDGTEMAIEDAVDFFLGKVSKGA